MATVVKRTGANGNVRYEVRFIHTGVSHSLYGFTDKWVAEQFGRDLEAYIALKGVGMLDPRSIGWADDMFRHDPARYSKLQGWGIVPTRVASGTVGELVAMFLDDDTIKTNTFKGRRTVGGRLVKFFGAEKPVNSITRKEAEKFYTYMIKNLATATWKREIGRVKQCFNIAVMEEWITKNPFIHLKGGDSANKSRQFFITVEMAHRVLDACANARERLIFSLARFGGLRIPSELLYMKWTDIDLTSDRFIVRIPKKTHKREQERGEFETRALPMFPELLEAFGDYLDTLPEGASNWIFPSLQDSPDTAGARLTKWLRATLDRAGIPIWPRLFQNLRSTRETELVEHYPLQDVAEWLGNTPDVARKHYLQTRGENFTLASGHRTIKKNSNVPQKTPQKQGFTPCFTGSNAPNRESGAYHKMCHGVIIHPGIGMNASQLSQHVINSAFRAYDRCAEEVEETTNLTPQIVPQNAPQKAPSHRVLEDRIEERDNHYVSQKQGSNGIKKAPCNFLQDAKVPSRGVEPL